MRQASAPPFVAVVATAVMVEPLRDGQEPVMAYAEILPQEHISTSGTCEELSSNGNADQQQQQHIPYVVPHSIAMAEPPPSYQDFVLTPVVRTGWMRRFSYNSDEMMFAVERNLRLVLAPFLYTRKWVVLREGSLYVYGFSAENANLGHDLRKVYHLGGCQVHRLGTRLELFVERTGKKLVSLKSCEISPPANKEADLEQWRQLIVQHIEFHRSSSRPLGVGDRV